MSILIDMEMPKNCGECHSRIRYRAAEVSLGGYITCPVCGKTVWASTTKPVRMEETE